MLLLQQFDVLQSVLCLLLKTLSHSINGVKALLNKIPPLSELIFVGVFLGLQFSHSVLAVVFHVLSMVSDQTFASSELILVLFD